MWTCASHNAGHIGCTLISGSPSMPMNLELHRSGEDVWQRTEHAPVPWDLERWAAAFAAGGCLVAASYSRRPQNVLLAIGGALLAWWAATAPDQRMIRRAHIRASLPQRRRADPITEASEDSFPASDSPAWTTSTGN